MEMPGTNGWTEAIESIHEEAGIEKLFGPVNGRNVLAVRNQSPKYAIQLTEASKLFSAVLDGRKPVWQLREAMSTSDFPVLFADIISRSILTAYTGWPVTWPAVAKKVLVRDFRDNKLFLPMLGGDTRLTGVPEGTWYPETGLTEQTPLTFAVGKFGRKMSFTFESMVNDDLDFLKDMPTRLGRAARRTEERAKLRICMWIR
jgi:hypothetical protein